MILSASSFDIAKKITTIYKNVKQVLLSLEVKKGCGLENSILPMFVQKYS